MPVCHVVTFTFKKGTPDAAVDKLSAALDGLALNAGAISYRHGRDLQRREGNADYSVTAVFADYDAFTAYMATPDHLRIISELVAPQLESRSAVQFAVEGAAT